MRAVRGRRRPTSGEGGVRHPVDWRCPRCGQHVRTLVAVVGAPLCDCGGRFGGRVVAMEQTDEKDEK